MLIWAQICFVTNTVGKRLDECVVLRMGSRVEQCRGSASHGLRWAARQEALCFRRLMPNWYRLNESELCVQSVWAGGLDGPAIIGTDKPCVEECTGKRFMGTQGKERESGNEEEKVTMSMRNAEAVGEESGMIVRVLQDHEKDKVTMEKWAWRAFPWKSHSSYIGWFMYF